MAFSEISRPVCTAMMCGQRSARLHLESAPWYDEDFCLPRTIDSTIEYRFTKANTTVPQSKCLNIVEYLRVHLRVLIERNVIVLLNGERCSNVEELAKLARISRVGHEL